MFEPQVNHDISSIQDETPLFGQLFNHAATGGRLNPKKWAKNSILF
ncbi:hypothetical protein [Antarcticimicrobium sediminis]|nr:hypothetical protein [Antarcticimicrobium sediminis]